MNPSVVAEQAPVQSFPHAGFAKNLWTFASTCADDFLGSSPKRGVPSEHLKAAVDWLKRAQDATPDGGVSSRFSLRPGRFGWWSSYRETTGYIVETFYDVADYLGDENARDRALAMLEWLLEIQNPDGSISNPAYGPDGIVFDTGQVLFGLVRGYQELHEQRFLDAAHRAATWLANSLDEDGAWRRFSHLGTPHTYNSRVAWAMLEYSTAAGDSDVEAAARRNLDWATAQERDGYFEECAFRPGLAPFTHTIAYAIRGIFEAGEILGDPHYAAVAERAARAMLTHVREDGFIPGQVDIHGNPHGSYCCLTGNVQLAVIWFKLYRTTGDPRFLRHAIRATEFVMGTQDIHTSNLDIRGAIKGSTPHWGQLFGAPRGGYTPLAYPNWAAKFFVDALLLMRNLDS